MYQHLAGKGIILASLMVIILLGQAVAADQIYVNQTGWWRDGGAFNASSSPIQAGINAVLLPGSTVTVVDQGEHAYSVSFDGTVQNGITLDLGGATLNGTGIGSPGVTIDGKTGTTVKGGTINHYTHAILASGTCSDILLNNLTIVHPNAAGVQVGGRL
ncbi:MAG: hypothetical protein LUQ37_04225, partial [Methanoregulaceae archaeon]|nr:hypothetical protein [Methanoregulaceae archaeon]